MARVTIGGRTYEVEVRGEKVLVDGHEYDIKVREEAGYSTVNAGGVPYRIQLPAPGDRASGMTVQVDYRDFAFEYEGQLSGTRAPRDRITAGPAPSAGSKALVKGGVAAQIAGRVLRINVKPGDTVAKGDVLLILEAMKMENEIKAPSDGIVKDIPVAEGARVGEGDMLVVIEID